LNVLDKLVNTSTGAKVELNEKTSDFIEQMGLTFEHLGATRIAGRLFGLLLLTPQPMSLTELADRLGVSKASISTNARLTGHIGLTHRVSVPGDRRDYYEILPGAFESALARRLSTIHELIDLAQQGLNAIDETEDVARARLEKMRGFYEFFLAELNTAFTRWKKRE
jgi:DNA-binding transcriptional regulator GbsR (MarR family)